MSEENNSKKPLFYYVILAIVGVILLNAYIVSFLSDQQVEEVDYGTFLNDVENEKVESVEIQDNEINYTIKNDEDGVMYRTGKMEDPHLVERLYEKEIEFTSVIQEESSPFISFILAWILPFILLIAIGQFFIGRMQKSMGGGVNAMTFGKSKARIYAQSETGVRFEDVAGQDEAKEALQEIVDFLHHPERYVEIGAKIPKGVLLVGPPGTGKTLMAKAVAGESKVPFFSISGSEFVEMFAGLGAARVRDLFKQAQEKAPCIVFIDEIDAIGKSRALSAPHSNDEREQTLNQLLAEMDGFDSNKGVVILAATNRPEILDKALLRAGRFDRRIPLELPDLKGREAILKVHGSKVKMARDIDLQIIARATAGMSGADLANIVNEAALRAVKANRKEVIQEDLEEAVEVVIAGYERKNAVISKNDKVIISYHEIGHAIVAAILSDSAPVHKITIIPRTSGALGYTLQVEEEEKILLTKEQILNKITILMGGRAAEELVFNTMTSGAANDIIQATKLARSMVTRFGMSDEFDMMALETVDNPYLSGDTSLIVSGETAAKIDDEVLKIIKYCHSYAKRILEEQIEKLHDLAECLLEKETLTGEEFMVLLKEKEVESHLPRIHKGEIVKFKR